MGFGAYGPNGVLGAEPLAFLILRSNSPLERAGGAEQGAGGFVEGWHHEQAAGGVFDALGQEPRGLRGAVVDDRGLAAGS